MAKPGDTLPEGGEELRVLMLLADSVRPVPLDDIARLVPGPARDARDLVEQLERDGLVQVSDRPGIGTVVAITEKGRTVRKYR